MFCRKTGCKHHGLPRVQDVSRGRASAADTGGHPGQVRWMPDMEGPAPLPSVRLPGARKETSMHQMSAEMRACIEECLRCHSASVPP